MYKTVRHGENSLQYTILPQTEEILTNSGLRGKGRDYSPSVHVRRARRRSAARCMALVALGSVAALALALVPLYAMHGALIVHRGLDPSATPVPFLPTGRDIGKTRKKELKMTPDLSIFDSDRRSSEAPPRSQPNAATSPWAEMPALKPWRATEAATPPTPTFHERGAAPLFDSTSELAGLSGLNVMRSRDKDSIITPTVTPEPATSRRVRPPVTYTTPTATAPTPDPPTTTNFFLITMKPNADGRTTTSRTEDSERHKMNDLKETLLEADDDEDAKESLEDDEVFSLPPLEPAAGAGAGGSGGPGDADDDVTVSRAGGWYGARWPFVDTSSYFQWTGYSPGDNLLLPLLVAALSSLALVLLLALALRRRHRTHCAKAQVGKLTADLQEDNTNLLTAENAEDE